MILLNSNVKGKRYAVRVDGRLVNFGSDSYDNYTIHKDPKRKNNYISRHRRREDWHNPRTAGFWSRWVLWNKPSLSTSFSDAVKKAEKYFH